MEKAIFKFENKKYSIVCSNCKTITKTEDEFNVNEWNAISGDFKLDSQYCEECAELLEKLV